MIKPEQLGYYILSAIAISVLSLALSIVSLRQEVGRYQLFVTDPHEFAYVFDTKTSRLFLRNSVSTKTKLSLRRGSREGEAICLDLGIVNRPISTLESNVIVQVPDSFVSDKKTE